ncbi:hypothetical protein E2C01_088314 [Portunus trituberculatus]|uniref:Secreted protein n=1 Tax=Portunus trituberculatus TaxID=210409 RepID=A0A5B7JAE8_PORTR|nr:hypothetical protein [Portunus trituberculatus]
MSLFLFSILFLSPPPYILPCIFQSIPSFLPPPQGNVSPSPCECQSSHLSCTKRRPSSTTPRQASWSTDSPPTLRLSLRPSLPTSLTACAPLSWPWLVWA